MDEFYLPRFAPITISTFFGKLPHSMKVDYRINEKKLLKAVAELTFQAWTGKPWNLGSKWKSSAEVLTHIVRRSDKPNFVFIVAHQRGQPVAVSWGYRLQGYNDLKLEMGHVPYELNFYTDKNDIFLFAENIVRPELRGLGLGTELTRLRFNHAITCKSLNGFFFYSNLYAGTPVEETSDQAKIQAIINHKYRHYLNHGFYHTGIKDPERPNRLFFKNDLISRTPWEK